MQALNRIINPDSKSSELGDSIKAVVFFSTPQRNLRQLKDELTPIPSSGVNSDCKSLATQYRSWLITHYKELQAIPILFKKNVKPTKIRILSFHGNIGMSRNPKEAEEAETKNPFVLFIGIKSKREKCIEMSEHSHRAVGKFSSRDDEHYQCFLRELMDVVKKGNISKTKGEIQLDTRK